MRADKATGSYALYIILAVISAGCYIAFFSHIGSYPIKLWDESRLAVNAAEMMHNHQWFVIFYNGSPDEWSTKPPLVIWIITCSLKLFGNNEIALRLPSALFATGTVFLIFYFIKQVTKDLYAAFIAAFVLITSQAYTGLHIAATADYDVYITFFTTLTIFSFYYFIYPDNKKSNKYLAIITTAVILGVLAKSITIFIILPGLLIFSLYEKKTIVIIKNPWLYASVCAATIAIVGYYCYRESLYPGYIKHVIENELGGRYNKVLENNSQPFFYFWEGLFTRYNPWVYLIPISIVSLLLFKDIVLNRVKRLVLISGTVYWLVISNSKTKVIWYDAPLYPLAAVLIGLTLYEFIQFIIHKETEISQHKTKYIKITVIAALFILPFKDIAESRAGFRDELRKNYLQCYPDAIKTHFKAFNSNKRLLIAENSYCPPILFYKEILNNKQIIINPDLNNLAKDDTILSCNKMLKDSIEHNYIFDKLIENKYFSSYVIKQKNN